MKLKIDHRKYKKRMIAFLILMAFSLHVMIIIIGVHIVKSNEFDLKTAAMLLFLFLLFLFLGMLARFYYRLKKQREYVMVFENGEFINYSQPMVKPVSIKIEEIKSIDLLRSGKVNQYKIVSIKEQMNKSELGNQLKKNHLYVTDYIVNSKELDNLMGMIQKERN